MRPCVVSASKSGAVSPSWSVMLRLRIRSRALRPASPPQIFGIRGPVSQSIGPKNIILPLRASLSTAEYWDLACNRALAAAVAEVRKHGPHVDSPVLALSVMLGPLPEAFRADRTLTGELTPRR